MLQILKKESTETVYTKHLFIFQDICTLPEGDAWHRASGVHVQWRIHDFAQGDAPTPKIAIIFKLFAENCMKMDPQGRAHPWRPPFDPPMMYLHNAISAVSEFYFQHTFNFSKNAFNIICAC